MSFAIAAVAAVGTASAGGGAVLSYYQGEKALKEQRRANQTAEQAARRADQQAEQEFNRANQKTPDILALMRANALAAGGGVSGTVLTGASGVDAGKALLGKAVTLGK